jgi:predicted tellurium resistance membrane protein TerC
MEKPSKLKKFKYRLFDNRAFQVVFALVALFLAYVFISWAIDSGSLLDYTIALLLIFIGLRELALAIFKKR